ncbi:hypothetical protein OTU49_016093 [Cherax quadricarinatus]|uniref:Uncharacterized protein n=1 Tax=Cherax quadricarinatus TaxID=27406 RepID=A0AAW0Y9H9_CHEQU
MLFNRAVRSSVKTISENFYVEETFHGRYLGAAGGLLIQGIGDLFSLSMDQTLLPLIIPTDSFSIHGVLHSISAVSFCIHGGSSSDPVIFEVFSSFDILHDRCVA